MAAAQVHHHPAVEEALLRRAAHESHDRRVLMIGIALVVATAITLIAAIVTLLAI